MSRIGSWPASALQSDARFDRPGPAATERATLFYPCYPGNPWLNSLRCLAKELLGFTVTLPRRIFGKAGLERKGSQSGSGLKDAAF